LAQTLVPSLLLPPLLGNVVTEFGVLPPNQSILGSKPIALAPWMRITFALALYCASALVACSLWRGFRRARASEQPPVLMPEPGMTATMVWLTLPATAAYLAALLNRCMTAEALPVFDRYLLPAAGMLIPLLALVYHSRLQPRIAATGWITLACLAAVGIATTHDQLAASRAVLAATVSLRSAGVVRADISAGYAYDGWTQLLMTGRITNPPEASEGGETPRFWFSPYTPAVRNCYYVVLSPQPGLELSPYPPVSYTAWLPPGRREVLVEKNTVTPKGCASLALRDSDSHPWAWFLILGGDSRFLNLGPFLHQVTSVRRSFFLGYLSKTSVDWNSKRGLFPGVPLRFKPRPPIAKGPRKNNNSQLIGSLT
jgi:hypothetical protein